MKEKHIGFRNEDGIYLFTEETHRDELYGNPKENGFAAGTIKVEEELAEEYFNIQRRAEEIEAIFERKIDEKNQTVLGWVK